MQNDIYEGLTEHEMERLNEIRDMMMSNNSLTDFVGEVILYDEDTGNSYADDLYAIFDVISKHYFDQMVITEDAE